MPRCFWEMVPWKAKDSAKEQMPGSDLFVWLCRSKPSNIWSTSWWTSEMQNSSTPAEGSLVKAYVKGKLRSQNPRLFWDVRLVRLFFLGLLSEGVLWFCFGEFMVFLTRASKAGWAKSLFGPAENERLFGRCQNKNSSPLNAVFFHPIESTFWFIIAMYYLFQGSSTTSWQPWTSFLPLAVWSIKALLTSGVGYSYESYLGQLRQPTRVAKNSGQNCESIFRLHCFTAIWLGMVQEGMSRDVLVAGIPRKDITAAREVARRRFKLCCWSHLNWGVWII